MKRLTEFWWQTASLIAPTPERDDDVDASVAGSLWILGVLGASMFALLFVAGLCYCVCPSAAFCDNDENESVYCEDSPMVPICVHFLMFDDGRLWQSSGARRVDVP